MPSGEPLSFMLCLQVGGIGAGAGKVSVIQQINHQGEVNRARCMPQNPFMIATKTVMAEVRGSVLINTGARSPALAEELASLCPTGCSSLEKQCSCLSRLSCQPGRLCTPVLRQTLRQLFAKA